MLVVTEEPEVRALSPALLIEKSNATGVGKVGAGVDVEFAAL